MTIPFHPVPASSAAAAILLLLLGFTTSHAAASPGRIVVYTVSSLPVSVPANLAGITTVIHLDRVAEIENLLSQGLEHLPEDRRADAAGRRLTAELREELHRSWQALFLFAPGNQGRLTHLPAIVLDNRAVWYGHSIRRAVTRYRNLKIAEGGS